MAKGEPRPTSPAAGPTTTRRRPFDTGPFLTALWPILYAAYAILVASDFSATSDFLLLDAGLVGTDECTPSFANSTLAWYNPLETHVDGHMSTKCGWIAVGIDITKAVVVSIG